jgi:hypothetical protein
LGDLIHAKNGNVEEFLYNSYESLKTGNEEAAMSFLKEALKIDFEHEEVLYALKCLNWWLEKIQRMDDSSDSYTQGAYILSQWESYYKFLDRIGEAYDSCQYALKRFVFLKAYGFFLSLLKDSINKQDSSLLLLLGRCCKGSGEWEEALGYLEQASRLKREDSAVLSELADVKALLGDMRAAKVLFREAFYLDPQGVDLPAMESELIGNLRDRVKNLGYKGDELAEWIPVWGCIWGVFSVKRELKPVEAGRLKQSILSLENEYRLQSSNGKNEKNKLLKPKLLNRYFWLIDHYGNNRDNPSVPGMIDETMIKIKFIDPVIYGHYIL